MARGGYTFAEMRQMDSTEILFLLHYQNLAQKEQQEFISSALGIVWNKKDMVENENSSSSPSKPLEKLFIPLSVAVNPDILDYVKKQFKVSDKKKCPVYIGGGEYMPRGNEVVNSMEDLSKEDFLKLIGKGGR
jgi:hypothetical protein